jgi:hypothetical protein
VNSCDFVEAACVVFSMFAEVAVSRPGQLLSVSRTPQRQPENDVGRGGASYQHARIIPFLVHRPNWKVIIDTFQR